MNDPYSMFRWAEEGYKRTRLWQELRREYAHVHNFILVGILIENWDIPSKKFLRIEIYKVLMDFILGVFFPLYLLIDDWLIFYPLFFFSIYKYIIFHLFLIFFIKTLFLIFYHLLRSKNLKFCNCWFMLPLVFIHVFFLLI